MDFQQIWETIKNFFVDNVWNIVRFFAVLIIGFILIISIMQILKKIFKARNVDPVASRFVLSLIRFILWFAFVLILLAMVGVEVTGLTAAVSAIVLAIGVALKDNISNLANGLILVGSKKYKTGDYIIVGSVEGSIIEINVLFTVLKTPDGKQIVMPNSTMVNSQVTNNSAFEKRRVAITYSVAYDSDVSKVKEVILSVMRANGKVYLDPAPFCRLKALSSSSIDFFAHCWCDTEDYWDVYYDLIENTFNELKKNGIAIPYQQIEYRERTDTPEMPIEEKELIRVEKERVMKKQKITLEDIADGEALQKTLEKAERKAKKAKEKKEKKK